MLLTKNDSGARRSAVAAVALFALAKLLFHLLTNGEYGFHRDELQTLDDARHLAWGFVAYPPVAPLLGRLELTLFGTSLTGFRFLAAAAQSLVIVLAAVMARRLGGGRAAQWIAAFAVAISPVSLGASSLFQYVSFDMLWWVAIAWMIAALAESGDERWWLGIGAVIGVGVETKYTIVFLVAGVVAGVILTPMRRQLRSGWLWGGVALSLLIAAPNLLWQYQHDFISLDFLRHIHARDVRIGRTDHFLLEQLYVAANPVTIPLWATGLAALLFARRLRSFRILGIMVIVPFAIFLIAKGRAYYAAPLYVTLIAAGAVVITTAVERFRTPARRLAFAATSLVLALGSTVAIFVLPVAPVGSNLWKKALEVNGDLREEFGWIELTEEVARIWNGLSPAERAATVIFASNYGEAGAINLYGPRYGLPRAISGINSFWYRGYDNPHPAAVIVLGASREELAGPCSTVELVGHVRNQHDVPNEESTDHPDIFRCRGLRIPFDRLWAEVRSFG